MQKTIRLPKVGEILASIHRRPAAGGTLGSATLSRDTDGRYYISLQYKYPDSVCRTQTGTGDTVGLDMSMGYFYVDSNGDHAELPRFYRMIEEKLIKEQRKLSHMEKDSNNYKRQKARIARLHAKAKHQRSDFLHKLSYNLVMRYDTICVEDLNMKAMSGGLHLGKSVHDLGWGAFISMLEYKCSFYGKKLIKVDRYYASSRLCHHCGNRHPDLALSDRLYVCPSCGTVLDRDWNAAMNIREEGLRLLNNGSTLPSAA